MAEVPDPVGTGEMGRLLGVTQRCVQYWHEAGLTPEPLVERPLLWRRRKVLAWLDKGRALLAERVARRPPPPRRKGATRG